MGQVTYIPKETPFNEGSDRFEDIIEKEHGSTVSIANAYGGIFKSLQEVEDKFFKASNIEIIISPIAIYTEQTI